MWAIGESFKRPNAKVVVPFDGIPHLCFFALKDIAEDEQLLINYGIKKYPFVDRVSQYF